jgi:hypothetical protein
VARFRETAAGAAVLACLALLAALGGGATGAGAAEVICEGDKCQPLPAEPEDPTPGTLVPNPGNPPLHFSEPKKKHEQGRKHRKHHRGGRHEHGKGGRTGRSAG